MKLATGFLTLFSAALFSISSAQAAFVENDYNCDLSLGEAIDCGENAVKVEKKRLNKIYMSAYHTLSSSQKSQLDKEQAAWLKKRNKECEFKQEGLMNNMMVYQMVGADVCTANESQKRSKSLAERYKVR
ncbi:DUF1311 domain-containing protein [Psychrobacter frigidicola]|uniref:DUF1311 domain-containing protein n=1 Tax=Psychrobacter frigidicola TaxID=45611 RepID=A0A5C7A743_9GAMM|nr:lysozyme inhibitor LprI family protein [Psychrobacter frigidicola]TXD98525.1 DUF1311 domain-containing protein [Psychrobacter frigidicola]